MQPAARERLLDTALAALAEGGRETLSAARLAARAGLTETELAAEFDGLDDCLDAAYEQLTARLVGVARAGCERGRSLVHSGAESWPAGVRGGLEALLGELAANPTQALALTQAYPALGARQRTRYEAFCAEFAASLADGRELAARRGAKLPDEVEILALGAAESIVFEAVVSGRTAALAEMAPSILFSLLAPFLGAKAAAIEMEKAASEA